jgi:hypothetical protein
MKERDKKKLPKAKIYKIGENGERIEIEQTGDAGEKLQRLIDEQRKLRKRLNPLGEKLKDITAVPQRVKELNNSIKVDLPKSWVFDCPKLYETAEKYLKIQNKTIKIYSDIFKEPKYISNLKRLQNTLIEAKKELNEAENNYFYQLAIEELERKDEHIKSLKTERKDFEKEINKKDDLINGLKETLDLLMLKLGNKTKQPKTTKAKNLKPTLTPEQIQQLHIKFQWLFEAKPEQWQNLFSENEIQEFEKPIICKSETLTDIALFLYHLKENELIECNRYPAIIGRAKAFLYKGEIVTTKQINDAKNNNNNFPFVGKNYNKIEEIIIRLK